MWEAKGIWTLVTLPFVIMWCLVYGVFLLLRDLARWIEQERARRGQAAE